MDGYNITLNELPLGEKARVKGLEVSGLDRRRMLDLGLVNNTVIEALQKSPSGDPIAYLIRGAVIALRSDLTSLILVELI